MYGYSSAAAAIEAASNTEVDCAALRVRLNQKEAQLRDAAELWRNVKTNLRTTAAIDGGVHSCTRKIAIGAAGGSRGGGERGGGGRGGGGGAGRVRNAAAAAGASAGVRTYVRMIEPQAQMWEHDDKTTREENTWPTADRSVNRDPGFGLNASVNTSLDVTTMMSGAGDASLLR